MPQIAIISSSIRPDRNSHRVALYFQNYLMENNIAITEMLDLQKYNFPIFDNRLSSQENPTPDMLSFASEISKADGIIIVTPEYNGGYPASLKNVIDFLYNEWKGKPIALSTVSMGNFGGSQVITSLQFTLWKIGALTVPVMFAIPNVTEKFDELGTPKDKPVIDKLAAAFIKELLWCIESNNRMASPPAEILMAN